MAIYHSDGIEIRERPRNVWRDVLIGMLAGVAGTVAMNAFSQAVARAVSDEDEEEGEEGQEEEPGGEDEEDEGPLDDVALVGPFHREEESAPETLGRVGYARVKGVEPSDETRALLATQIHWATGVVMGGLYGLTRGDAGEGLDLGGGALFGAGTWFMNDEVMVPVLGLSEGPTAHGLDVHARALGAHLVFGLATAVTARVLDRIL